MIYNDDTSIDQRLRDLDRQAVIELTPVLDVAAGLQEVLLDAHHRRTITELTDLLDTEAGLAAVLSTRPSETGRDYGQLPTTLDPAAAARNLIKAIPAEQRLILRAHPASNAIINAVGSSRALASAIERARSLRHVLRGGCDVERARDHARNLAIDHALDADRTLVRALDRVLERDLGRGSHLDNIIHLARDRDRALARALIRALDHALNYAVDHALEADRSLERIRSLSLDHGLVELKFDSIFHFDSIRSRSITRTLDRVLDQSLAFARDFARDFARRTARGTPGHSAHALDRAFKRAHETNNLGTDRAVDHALDCVLTYMQDLSDTDQRSIALVQQCVRLLEKPLAGRYELAPVQDGLGDVLAQGALDDVTDADLRQADLTSIDMAGLRWTLHSTRWPEHIDPTKLLQQSRETEPGSGIYIVMQGPMPPATPSKPERSPTTLQY